MTTLTKQLREWRNSRANEVGNAVAERFSSGFEICVHDIVTTAEIQFRDGFDACLKELIRMGCIVLPDESPAPPQQSPRG